MKERYGLLRTIISKDKRIDDKTFIPMYSDDLERLNKIYNYYIRINEIENIPMFNEVAIFDYETYNFVKNNFDESRLFVKSRR